MPLMEESRTALAKIIHPYKLPWYATTAAGSMHEQNVFKLWNFILRIVYISSNNNHLIFNVYIELEM